MTYNYPRIVLGALRGGSGKTILAMGVISALSKKGWKVVPFKKGPDFIDAGWLGYAAGRPCYNLDSFLMGPEQVLSSFVLHALPHGIAVIEGNRGLFDGMDIGGTFSTAELAKLLHAPILLLADCTKSTRTVAAMVLGCLHLDPDVRICGVVLNQVGTARQETLVRRAVEEVCGIPVLGAVPRIRDHSLPERHMGLIPPQEHPEADQSLKVAEGIASRFLDLDSIVAAALAAGPVRIFVPQENRGRVYHHEPPTIGIIRDRSFWFYYPENLEDLRRWGATLKEINSLKEKSLPVLDGLYIGGGFPETHAHELASNEPFRKSLLQAIYDGMPLYAECGGLMYLGKSLAVGDSVFPMTGAFPVSFQMENKPQGHGYTILETDGENPYFAKGTILHGHEFHYSRPLEVETQRIATIFKNRRGTGFHQGRDGLQVCNALALYSHIHSAGAKGWAKALVEQAEAYRFAKALSMTGAVGGSVPLANSPSNGVI
jgi:cobyrinic acid a,c-diamide synthase